MRGQRLNRHAPFEITDSGSNPAGAWLAGHLPHAGVGLLLALLVPVEAAWSGECAFAITFRHDLIAWQTPCKPDDSLHLEAGDLRLSANVMKAGVEVMVNADGIVFLDDTNSTYFPAGSEPLTLPVFDRNAPGFKSEGRNKPLGSVSVKMIPD